MRYLSLISIMLIGGSFGLFSCAEKEQDVKEMLRPVRYTKVFTTGGSRTRTFSGAARSGFESNLSFKVSGTVQTVPVKVGENVGVGQLLARLDPADFQLQAQQAEAALSQAKAQEQKAKADYDRVRGLYENNNAAKSDLDAARAAFESASANVKSAEKQLELRGLQLSYATLRAPVAGSIASVDIEVNENVHAGQKVIMLTASSDIEVEVAIPEILISQIQAGDAVTVTFDALAGKSYSGTVTEVGVASTGFATTFPVTVSIDNADLDILSGMAAEVAFQFESPDARERIMVPPVAVGEDKDGRFVFVVEPMNGDTATVRRVNVQTGDLNADGLEIFTGLSDGDLVVTAGVSKIIDGQKVKL